MDQPESIASPALVGRERESAELARALAGGPALVLVEGEAGVGKSRLVQEYLAGSAGQRRRALVAGCPPFRESLTLAPVVDSLRSARPAVADRRLSPLAGALRPLFPEWAGDLPPAPEPLTDPLASRHRMFRALLELVDRSGVELLVIEDVHWADDATLEFLLFLMSDRPVRDLGLVLTYRPDDVAAGSLLRRLTSRPRAGLAQARITLGLLDVEATAGLVSSMLGDEPVSEAFATFLHDRTDGLPLALEESVRLLSQRDDVIRRDGEWVRRSLTELSVPPTVRDSVLERVQRLGGDARRVLDAAAVLAEPAGDDVIAATAGLSGPQARAALIEAARSGLLGEDPRGRAVFRHVLMGRAVYDAMAGVERRRLHQDAGRALEHLRPPPLMQLTRHFRTAGDLARWARNAELAADAAAASDDHTTAVAVLEPLVTAGGLAAPDLARLATKLATAATARRESVDAVHARVIGVLRGILDGGGLAPLAQAELRIPLGRLLLQSGEFEAGRAELERAVPHQTPRPAEAAVAMTLLGYPLPGPRPAAEYRGWLERAERAAADLRSDLDRLSLTADRAAALLVLGEPDGWDVVTRLPRDMPTVEGRCQLARGHANVGYAALLWGRDATARRHLDRALELAEAARFARLSATVQELVVLADWLSGQWHGLAERAAALAADDDVEPNAKQGALLVTAMLGVVTGRQGAERELRGLLERVRPDSVAAIPLIPAAALARRELTAGRPDAALELTDAATTTVQTSGTWIWAAEIAPVRVDALLAAGRQDAATGFVAAFERGLGDRDAPAPAAALASCRAALAAAGGDHEGAAGFAAAAATRWARLPRPFEELLASEAAAGHLLDAGRTDDGVALLTRTHKRLAELGARADAARVARALDRHGAPAPGVVPARRGRRGYGDELSPRELEVVRLVVTGRTNREIARAVSRSPKTVAAQLNSAMRKLGVTSRTALAVLAVEAGLVGADTQR
ncbi:AAA family ATPase [Jiangella mangrovi]|uniref:DNA-binding CsgD family transcriptional regulator n=1 Tax=Jiangella mangrovi TaxID=1524084 RepID=A0A7W9GLR3_9ACTN|nr:DNA-binding CsgD family transcriptional regulator [Jiangella mangrovi]